MEKLLNEFSVGLFFWQTLLFLALLFLLKKYAWSHILTAVNNREESIREGLESAEKAKEQMRQLKEDNKALLAEARAEKDEIIKSAREAKEQMINDAKAKAKEEADKMIESAKETIRAERAAAINDLKNQVAELSIQIAEKVIKNELSADGKQKELIAAAMKEAELN
jgi:F-type H+-transporting ATPase subunit b